MLRDIILISQHVFALMRKREQIPFFVKKHRDLIALFQTVQHTSVDQIRYDLIYFQG